MELNQQIKAATTIKFSVVGIGAIHAHHPIIKSLIKTEAKEDLPKKQKA